MQVALTSVLLFVLAVEMFSEAAMTSESKRALDARLDELQAIDEIFDNSDEIFDNSDVGNGFRRPCVQFGRKLYCYTCRCHRNRKCGTLKGVSKYICLSCRWRCASRALQLFRSDA